MIRKPIFRKAAKLVFAVSLSVLLAAGTLPAAALTAAAEDTADTKSPASTIIPFARPDNSSWLQDFDYTIDEASRTVTLNKCGAAGPVTVYGCLLIDGVPFHTALGEYCFKYCPELTSLTFQAGSGVENAPAEGSDYKTLACPNMVQAFAINSKLTYLDITGVDFAPATNLASMVSANANLKTFIAGVIAPEVPVSANSMFSGDTAVEAIDLSGMNAEVTNCGAMFANCRSAKKIVLGPRFDTGSVKAMNQMFQATSCPVDLSLLNTRSVTDMTAMFMDREGNEPINLDGPAFDTSNVEYMSSIFAFKNGNPKVSLGRRFTTAKVRNFSYAFQNFGTAVDGSGRNGDPSENIDFSTFDLLACTNLAGVFRGSAFRTIDLSQWKTPAATDMNSMFKDARWVTKLDVSGLDATKVTNTSRMFQNTGINGDLQTIDGLQSLSTQSVLNMSSMFEGDSTLKNLDLSGLRTDKAGSLYRMFYGCTGLDSIDITAFNINPLLWNGQEFGGAGNELITAGKFKRNGKTDSTYATKIANTWKGLNPYGDGTLRARVKWVDDKKNSDYSHFCYPMPVMYRLKITTTLSDGRANGVYNNQLENQNFSVYDTIEFHINYYTKQQVNNLPESDRIRIMRDWFCPANTRDRENASQPILTNNATDTNYYEIEGYDDEYGHMTYHPTQQEWIDTLKECTYNGPAVTISNGQPTIAFKKEPTIYGFYKGPQAHPVVTLKAPSYELTAASGRSYEGIVDPSATPVFPRLTSFSYGAPFERNHSLPAIHQKGFDFLGWYTEDGQKVSNDQGRYTPNGSTDEILVPRFRIREDTIVLKKGELPGGYSADRVRLLIRPSQAGLWTEANDMYKAVVTVNEGLFLLPTEAVKPAKGENKLCALKAWTGADDTEHPAAHVFDGSDASTVYTAAWEVREMTEEEKKAALEGDPAGKSQLLIDAIDPLDPDPAAVKAAREAYDALSEAQKSELPAGYAEKLEKAEKIISDRADLTDLQQKQAEAAKTLEDSKKALDESKKALEEALAAQEALQKQVEALNAAKGTSDADAAKARADLLAAQQEAREKAAAAAAKQQAAEAEAAAAKEALQKAQAEASAQKQSDQKATEKALKEYARQISEQSQTITALKKQLEETDDTIAALTEAAKTPTTTPSQISDYEAKIRELERQNAVLDQELDNSRKQLSDRIAAEKDKPNTGTSSTTATPANPFDNGWTFTPANGSEGSSASKDYTPSASSGSGKKSESDEFLISWLNSDSGSGSSKSKTSSASAGSKSTAANGSTEDGTRGSAENETEDTDSSSLFSYFTDEDEKDEKTGEEAGEGAEKDGKMKKKAASVTGSGEKKSSSPLRTILGLILIAAATASAIAFTWRKKTPAGPKPPRKRNLK